VKKMTSKGMDELDSIGKRVAAKSCSKNPSVAKDAVELRHEVSDLKSDLKAMTVGLGSTLRTAIVVTTDLNHQLTASLAEKDRVLMLGEAAVRKLVPYKMAEETAMTEAEALVSVISDISVDAFGATWRQDDVTSIRSWCTLPDGGSVVGGVRGEVARVTAFMPQVAQALAPAVVAEAAGNGVAAVVARGDGGAVEETALGFSPGSAQVMVDVELDSDGLDSDGMDSDGYSSDEGIGVRVAKRRRVSMGESGDEGGGGDVSSSGGGSTVETQP
jgi:hypothetical protein